MNIFTKIFTSFASIFTPSETTSFVMDKETKEELVSLPQIDVKVVDQSFLRSKFYYCRLINELVAIDGDYKIYLDKVLNRKRVDIFGKKFYHSVLVYMYFYGEIQQGYVVDHKDRQTDNDDINNLRKATPQQNSRNRGTTSTIGYKGVTKNGNRWRARITCDGKIYSIGNYKSPEEAAIAYDEAALELFGEFAYTNFIHAPSVLDGKVLKFYDKHG